MREYIAAQADLVVNDVVVMEVLAGARDEDRAAQLRRLLNRFGLLPVTGLADFEDAAQIYRQCRRSGETIPKMTDCLVAAVAIRDNTAVLHCDRDFEIIARCAPLRVEHPGP
jgi:predicted nucleic acid-binding protein